MTILNSLITHIQSVPNYKNALIIGVKMVLIKPNEPFNPRYEIISLDN